jgi:SAM-dependent methyltransferase
VTETLSAQQFAYWNGPVGERWAAKHGDIDRSLASIAEALIVFAKPKPGERVLDIGCGAGFTTLALARAVGPAGSVTGVDISAPMLAMARKRAQAEKAAIEFLEADASAYAWEPRYDLLFSRFGVMFFADPAAAFANLHRALKPEARLAFVCWRSLPENIWAYAPYKAAQHLFPAEAPSDPLAPGPFAFADKTRIADILSRAGFHGIAIEALDTTMNLGATPEHAAKEALVMGPLARAAGGLPDDVRAKIVSVVEQRLTEFSRAGGVVPPAACWLVSART